MKVFNEKSTKSWVIGIEGDDHGYASVAALDGNTGEVIGYLITFQPDGGVETDSGAFDVLKAEGYDPFQYGNDFDGEGRLIVRKDTA